MARSKQIEHARRTNFAVTFSNGNKGRTAKLELVGGDVGAQTLVSRGSFFALDRDPEGKGDDVVISMGKEAPELSHTVDRPSEIWQQQDDNGLVTSIEIVDEKGNKLIVTFFE